MILAGTPGGTVFRGIYPSAYLRGIFNWTASGFSGSAASHVIESHIQSAKASGDYLRPGDIVAIEADKMGALVNRIE